MIGVKVKDQDIQNISELLEEEYKKHVIDMRENLREEAKRNILKMQEENMKQFSRKRKKPKTYQIVESK